MSKHFAHVVTTALIAEVIHAMRNFNSLWNGSTIYNTTIKTTSHNEKPLKSVLRRRLPGV